MKALARIRQITICIAAVFAVAIFSMTGCGEDDLTTPTNPTISTDSTPITPIDSTNPTVPQPNPQEDLQPEPQPDPNAENPIEPEVPKMIKVQGIVKDEQGGVYPNVAVALRQAGAAAEIQNLETNLDGGYAFDAVPMGEYEVVITPPRLSEVLGMNPIAVAVADEDTAQVDFTLRMLPVEASLTLGDTDALGEVKNAAGEVPTNPDEPLFARNVFSNGRLFPILALDGHQVTLGEWKKAQGKARIACNGEVTTYTLEFTGLIPNGVYTIWNIILRKPQVPTNLNKADEVGGGALGLPDGSQNVMKADETGKAELQVSVTSGTPLSFNGEQPVNPLTTDLGFLLVVVYHIDGKSYGPGPGPEHTIVSHMLIHF